jgi:hypothetical protein
MRFNSIAKGGLLIAVFATAGWAQTQIAAARPCTPVEQQQAWAYPPPAVQPVKPEESGPQLPPPYQQLTVKEKFNVFVQHTYSPYTVMGAAFDAGMAQATGSWYTYGGGMEGYSKRFGASLADSESGLFFGRFLFPVLLRQDPRYLRSTSHGVFLRAGYALSRVAVTRNDSGRKAPNLSLIFSAVASSALANAYYPRRERSLGDTMGRTGGALLSTAGMNVLREFWPDIMNKFRNHGPKSLRKIEESPQVTKFEEMMMGPTAPSPCPAPSADPPHDR